MSNGPRILSFDIETDGTLNFKSDSNFVVIFGYKWMDEPEAHAIHMTRKEILDFNDKPLLEKASKIIEQADILVGHFASVFDRRFIQGRLLIHHLPPIPPTRLRDTCMILRSVANFKSNTLRAACQTLGLKHQKLDNGWPTAWFKVMRGDMQAVKEMVEYCKGDVLAVEDLYKTLLPFDNAHPRMVMDRTKCPIDGSDVVYRGYAYVGTNRYRRFKCVSCGKWGRETNAVKDK